MTLVIYRYGVSSAVCIFVTADGPNTNCEWFLLARTKAYSSNHVVVKVLSVTECMRLCQDVTCAALSYNRVTGECRFHSEHTDADAITLYTDDAPWSTYDYYCFEGISHVCYVQ